MRKVMGSSVEQLILQLVLESVVLVFGSAVIALALYSFLRPLFEPILGTSLPHFVDFSGNFVVIYLLSAVAVGVLAGIYPAGRLATRQILHSVKGQAGHVAGKNTARKVLLGIQFMVAMAVLTGAVVIGRQVSVFFSENLGFDKNHLLTAQVPRNWTSKGLADMETIRHEISSLPSVEQASISYDVPSAVGSGMIQVSNAGTAEQQTKLLHLVIADAHYADTYNIPMLAGKFFSADRAGENGYVVINKQAANLLGYTRVADAVGQQVQLNGRSVAVIAGVTQDFYLHTMHTQLPPVIWTNVFPSSPYRFLTIRIRPGSIGESIAAIQAKWKELMPDAPFEYTFMDETLQQMYAEEMQLRKALGTATVIILIIVILGIVGLVSLMVHQRMKEIGIRKVLGASMIRIIGLFVVEFVWVYGIALLLVVPPTYYLLGQWLSGYHVRTDLDVWVFFWPISGLSVLMLLSIGLQVMRVATDHPVHALRDE